MGSTMYGATGGGLGNKIPSGYKAGRIQNFTPEQMQLLSQMYGHIGPESYLSKLSQGDEQTFQQMEAPAYREFAGLQGNLASRFSQGGGAGSLSSRRSSGFQNTASQAGNEFLQGLQSRRYDLKRQALQDLMGISESLLNQRPYENFLVPKETPWWQSAIQGVGGAAKTAAQVGSFFI